MSEYGIYDESLRRLAQRVRVQRQSVRAIPPYFTVSGKQPSAVGRPAGGEIISAPDGQRDGVAFVRRNDVKIGAVFGDTLERNASPVRGDQRIRPRKTERI